MIQFWNVFPCTTFGASGLFPISTSYDRESVLEIQIFSPSVQTELTAPALIALNMICQLFYLLQHIALF